VSIPNTYASGHLMPYSTYPGPQRMIMEQIYEYSPNSALSYGHLSPSAHDGGYDYWALPGPSGAGPSTRIMAANRDTLPIASPLSPVSAPDYNILTEEQEPRVVKLEVGSPAVVSDGLSRARAERRFECYVCKRTFTAKHTVERHLNAHFGINKHPCPECGGEFTQKSDVRRHMKRTHADAFAALPASARGRRLPGTHVRSVCVSNAVVSNLTPTFPSEHGGL
jgi:hypothetical protein